MDSLRSWLPDLSAAASHSDEDVALAITLSKQYGSRLPLPGGGATAQRLGVLAELGRTNLVVARVFEAHTDALAILAESGRGRPDARSWGVFAAEAPSARLDATPTGQGYAVSGTKPWCSLGGMLDAALVTAHVAGGRQLFEVDLHHPGVHAQSPQGWVARGMRTVTSGPVDFDAVPAIAVGGPQWYLQRSGFAWGGIGVAACWHGGAQSLADSLMDTARTRTRELDNLHLGAVDIALQSSANALDIAAAAIDAGTVIAPEVLALRTRSVVAQSAELVLSQVGHALGPSPLAFDERYAGLVADLSLYIRQHHAERDLAALGATLKDVGA